MIGRNARKQGGSFEAGVEAGWEAGYEAGYDEGHAEGVIEEHAESGDVFAQGYRAGLREGLVGMGAANLLEMFDKAADLLATEARSKLPKGDIR